MALEFGQEIVFGPPRPSATIVRVAAYLGDVEQVRPGQDAAVGHQRRVRTGCRGSAEARPERRDDATTNTALAEATVPAPAPLLAAEGLAAGYGHVPAIEDIDLDVAVGEVVVILGANASGKSTTLMALAGLLDPMAGRVRWLGKVCRKPLHVRARQGMAYVLGIAPSSRA